MCLPLRYVESSLVCSRCFSGMQSAMSDTELSTSRCCQVRKARLPNLWGWSSGGVSSTHLSRVSSTSISLVTRWTMKKGHVLTSQLCVCVCVCVCVCACVRACVRVCECVHVHVHTGQLVLTFVKPTYIQCGHKRQPS